MLPTQPMATGGLPVGTIVAFAGNKIPQDWLVCDGSQIPSQYTALCEVLGNSTNTPDLSGRVLVATGIGTDINGYPCGFRLNETGGEYRHTLLQDEMPAHNHSYTMGGMWGGGTIETNSNDNMGLNGQLADTGFTGNSMPHNNIQPFYGVYYIIYAGTPLGVI